MHDPVGSGRARRIARVCASLAATITISAFVVAASFAADFTCAPAPITGCITPTPPHPTRLWMNTRASHRRDNVVWKWYRGASAQALAFADPTTTSDYAFCLYGEGSGGETSLLFAATAPAASYWRQTGTGFRYRTGTGLPNGLTKVYLDARRGGRGRIVLKGRGRQLHLPDLPVTVPLRVQLQAASGECFEGRYGSGVAENGGQRFRGHADEP